MVERIENFLMIVETVLDLLRLLFVDQLRAHIQDFRKELDDWLAAHKLTLPQLVGNFLTIVFGFMALGAAVDVCGLAVGQWLNENTARGIIAFGAVVVLAGALPLFILTKFAHDLYDLVLRGGIAATEILAKEGNNIPTRIRTQLQGMQNRRNLAGTVMSLYAAFAAATVAFLRWPNFNCLYGVIVIAVAISGVITLRKINRVLGHGVIKMMMAGVYGLVGGGAVFVFFRFIAIPFVLEGWPNAISNQRALQLTIVLTIATVVITFLSSLNMRLAGEEDDLREGKGPLNKHKLAVDEIDPSTGKSKSFKKIDVKPFDWKPIFHSKLLWVGLVVFAFFFWTEALHHPNPLSTMEMTVQSITVGGILLIAVLLFWAFSPEKK